MNRGGPARRAAAILGALLLLIRSDAGGWGFDAHRAIQGHAVRLLPSSLPGFFRRNAPYLIEHSVDPDLWRREGHRFYSPSEGPRHYINIDRFAEFPFSGFPETRSVAEERFGRATVAEAGTLPWRIDEVFLKLVEALRSAHRDDILLWAAALGHYVADAHVPFHVTRNHDGQESGHRGIHSRFESELFAAFGDEFSERALGLALALSPGTLRGAIPADPELRTIGAYPVSDRVALAFTIVRESYAHIRPILDADHRHRDVSRRRQRRSYFEAMRADVGGIMVDRLARSALVIARLWTSAWIAAGRPDLRDLTDAR